MSKKILLVDDSRTALMLEQLLLGAKMNYTIIGAQVGGRKGRKVVFQTSDGSFTVKEI
jgi:chemotaxis receptor (MCP) glutamine deamidase CheD